LGLSALSAHAIQVTSVTAQTDRVEGQSVEISAVVNWEQSFPIQANPLTGPFFRVTASAAGKTINLSYDSASGRYQGLFQGLVIGGHPAFVTASKTTRTASIPVNETTIKSEGHTNIFVRPQPGCFNFALKNDREGWTAEGMFDGDLPDKVTQANLPLNWVSTGYASVGAVTLNMGSSIVPATNLLTTGYWRYDFRSSDLSTNIPWQGITGLSYRLGANLNSDSIQVQAILVARNSNGRPVLFRATNNGNPVFHSLSPGAISFQTFIDNIKLESGSTLLGIHLRVFGIAGAIPPSDVRLDLICPRR
jgi:hypothetical protein